MVRNVHELTVQLVASLPAIPGWSRPDPKSTKEEEEEEDLDIPPPFPLLNSHQRSQAPVPSTPSFSVAPPSPPRIEEEPASELNIAILPDATPIGDMAPPPSTTVKPNFGLQAGGDGSKKTTETKKKKGKVALAPGCSALDWARLTQSGKDLKGIGGMGFLRVTPDELAKACFDSYLSCDAQ